MAEAAINVGDRVAVGETKLLGTVKFVGKTEFATGDWMGIELDEKAGKNDGQVKEKRYFQCPAEHGIFVRPSSVTKLEASSTTPTTASPTEVSPTTTPPSSEAAPAPAAPPQGSPGSLAPPKEKPKRLTLGERSLEKEKARAQLELAQAMEDHDVEALRRILPVANNLGINPKEVDAAKRILSFEVQQSLVEEVEMVRSTVTHLAESVAKVEEQAARQHPAVAGLLQRLGPELEKRLWSRLQPSIDRIVTGVLDKVSASLEGRARSMDLAEKAEVPAATTGSLGLEAYTFRHFDLNGDGFITQDEFDEVRAKILSGQPLPKVEPAAALEEQQVAASKIQAVYRGRAAREQVPRKKGEATDSLTGKLPTDAEKELAKVICRSVYSKIALTSQDSQAPSSDEREAARYVVNHVLEKAMEAQPAK